MEEDNSSIDEERFKFVSDEEKWGCSKEEIGNSKEELFS
jgi:hypothetical protein